MRAILLRNLSFSESDKLLIKGEAFHHLKNVLRVKKEQELLLLNGIGSFAKSKIINILKNEIEVEILTTEKKSDNRNIDIALGHIKKDAFFEALKKSIECDVKKLIVFESEYSQRIVYKDERMKKIIQSSIEQSNAFYELDVEQEIKLSEISFKDYDFIFFFNSQRDLEKSKQEARPTRDQRILIIIGPEGGFSSKEIEELEKVSNLFEINAKTNIMRSPNALSYAIGHVQAMINMRI